MRTLLRAVLWVAYAVYFVIVAYLVWNPEPAVPSYAVWHLTDWLGVAGISVPPQYVEFGLNVLMFVPMSLVGTFVLPRLRIADWVLVGFVGSFAIEMVQLLFLPSRSADPKDVVSNTMGALVGAVIAWVLIRIWRWWRPGGQPQHVAAPSPSTVQAAPPPPAMQVAAAPPATSSPHAVAPPVAETP